MNNEAVIKLNHISKVYKLYDKPTDRLKEAINPFKKKYHKSFYAVNDVSFEIKKGETIGIIGKNGSGKSTLLKMITGVLKPTTGEIEIKGRISALLELGAGFNPEYTGLENVYLNGTIMGFSKEEIDQKLEEILTFADIGDFIHQPVKVYSSGMFVRLAFAVAINVEPEILIVDEALAVGDVAFQNKCFRKFESFKKSGKTILFVTHSLDMVSRHCDKAILIQNGNLISEGTPNDVINIYTKMMTNASGLIIKKAVDNKISPTVSSEPNEELFFENQTHSGFNLRQTYNKNEFRWGDGRATILDYLIIMDNELDPAIIKANHKVELYVKYLFHQDVENFMCGVILKTLDGIVVFTHSTRLANMNFPIIKANEVIIVKFSFITRLLSSKYTFSVGCSEDLFDIGQDTTALDRRNDSIIIEVINQLDANGVYDPSMDIEVVQKE